MIQYPDTLPGPLLSGHALNQKPNLVRTEMESGQARARRRFISVPTIITSTWFFTEEQAASFETFIADELASSVEWFEMPIKTPIGNQVGQLRFVDDPRDNCNPTSIKNWQYKANIELKLRPLLTKEQYDLSILPVFKFNGKALGQQALGQQVLGQQVLGQQIVENNQLGVMWLPQLQWN